MESLHPASSYQRLKTSLEWIVVILESLTHQPGGGTKKKSNTPRNDNTSHNNDINYYIINNINTL